MRRALILLLLLLPFTPARADALTVRDVIELSKAKIGDQVLLALIDVDRSVFEIDTATLKQLKESGVNEAVIVAMIRSGRSQAAAEPSAEPDPTNPPNSTNPTNPEPQVIVIDHHDAAPPAPAYVPVAVPVYMPVPAYRPEYVTRTLVTEDGSAVRVREPLAPNCTKAEPVYWGNDGKRRAGTWEPPVQVVCR